MSYAKGKNFSFCHFWRPSWILAENEKLWISQKRYFNARWEIHTAVVVFYLPCNCFFSFKFWKLQVRNDSLWIFCRTSCGFSILLTTEVVPKIFLNLNVVGHLAVPVGWGSCLPRLAIFRFCYYWDLWLVTCTENEMKWNPPSCFKINLETKKIKITTNLLLVEVWGDLKWLQQHYQLHPHAQFDIVGGVRGKLYPHQRFPTNDFLWVGFISQTSRKSWSEGF